MNSLQIEASLTSLSNLLRPNSVAIVGASEDATRIGGRPLKYLRDSGFPGEVYPVNPNRDTVQGYPSYPTIESLPQAVDVVLLAISAAQTVEVVAACARRGNKSVIIFSANFAETGEPVGEARQRALRQIAQDSGMRVLGPNCLGAFNSALGFYGTFTQTFDQGFPAPGPIGLVSQSGAFGGHLSYLAKQRKLGIGYWLTTGNEVDIQLAEGLLWLVRDASVKVVLVYAETVRNGDLFVQALREAHALRKPVIVLKVGRSESGGRAAASHTGALAGQDAVYEAVLRQFGAYRVRSTEEMLDIAEGCLHGRFPTGRRLGILSMSGGIGIQTADAAELCGLEVAALPETAQSKIRELIPYAGTGNPIDLTASALNDPAYIRVCMEIALNEGHYDALIMFVGSGAASTSMKRTLLIALSEIRQQYPERLVLLLLSGPEAVIDEYRELDYLIGEDVDRAVKVLAALAQLGTGFHRPVRWSGPLPERVLKEIPADEYAAKQLLLTHGIPTLTEQLVSNPQQVLSAAQKISAPLVVKVVSPDILHKTEVGGVAVHLQTPEDACEAALAMQRRLAKDHPAASIRGYLVAPMCQGVELILGALRDEAFGPLVMVGLGGVHAEIFGDVVFRLAPFDQAAALEMIGELKAHQILEGVRGQPRCDVAALALALSRLSHFYAATFRQIAEVDINPFVVCAEGQGGYALDALMVASSPQASVTI